MRSVVLPILVCLVAAPGCTRPPEFAPTLELLDCPTAEVAPGDQVTLTARVTDPAGNDISNGSSYNVVVRGGTFQVEAVTLNNTVTFTIPSTAPSGTVVFEVAAMFAGETSNIETCAVVIRR